MTDASPPTTSPGSHYQPATAVMLIIVVLFVAGAFFMLRTNPVSSPTTTTSVTTTTLHHGVIHHPSKARVRVQVANGTNTSNLARTYTDKLQAIGWDTLGPLNANNKVAATAVYFNPGFRWAAQEIASSLHVSASSIQALNGLSPVAGAASDDVVVVLGPDVAIGG